MGDLCDYELLDFGGGRKLERFAQRVLDRPAPAADGVEVVHPELWEHAQACFQRTGADRGQWQETCTFADLDWHLQFGPAALELRLTEFGHVGVFPEQAENWDWISRHVREIGQPRVLNLFAYTGASSLAAAAAGAEVVHVDAARASVAWARRNAAHSGLAERPIRWIVEDARSFVRREIQRGRRYHGLILDPPTYGHGPRGHAWKLSSHLPALLAACGELLSPEVNFVLLTCHSPGIGPRELREILTKSMSLAPRASIDAGELTLATNDDRHLPSGVFARGADPSLPLLM